MVVRARWIYIVVALASIGCKTRAPQPDSGTLSGFSGEDCKSSRKDLAEQKPKLSRIRGDFENALSLYKEYLAVNGKNGSPANKKVDTEMSEKAQGGQETGALVPVQMQKRDELGDGVTSSAQCSRYLEGANTDSAGSVFNDLYQQCVEYFQVLSLVQAREAKLATPTCQQGKDNNIKTVFTTYCDSACSFTNVECGYTELQTSLAKLKFACGTKGAAEDAAKGYCREFGLSDCKYSDPIMVQGSDLAKPGETVAGSHSDSTSIEIGAFAGAEASVEYTGGVVVGASTSRTFTVQGYVSLEMSNGERQTSVGDYIEEGTETSCVMNITGFVNSSAKAFLGAGGAAKVFGNGVEIKAGASAGLELTLSKAYTAKLGAVKSSGGISKMVALQRCVPLAVKWLTTGVANIFGPYAKNLASHVADLKEADKREQEARQESLREAANAGSKGGAAVYNELTTRPFKYYACVGNSFKGWKKTFSAQAQTKCSDRAKTAFDYWEYYNKCRSKIIYCCTVDSSACK